MKIVIFNYSEGQHFWELFGDDGYSMCRMRGRNGISYMTTGRSCLKNAFNFREKLADKLGVFSHRATHRIPILRRVGGREVGVC